MKSMRPAKRVRLEGAHTLSTPVRFLILSDTHGAELPETLPPCDVLLHCGDLTENGTPESISAALQTLGKVEAKLKLVIAGNHDISLDKPYWISQGGTDADAERAEALVSSESSSEASLNGITFLKEGTHTFKLACGATFKIYASPYTPLYGASAFQYPSNEDRFNPLGTPPWAKNVGTETSTIPNDVDIVMTHGPPKYILDTTSDDESAGCEHLRRAIARVQPRLHCFGHIHTPRRWFYQAHVLDSRREAELDANSDSKSITKVWIGENSARRKGFKSLPPGPAQKFRENKQQTLCVNAAMEGTEPGVLEHPPWLVELDLPVVQRDMGMGDAVGEDTHLT
ncbi:hypothetical protein J4E83_000763 [Alternaria metachromatica]|uniref:uncharacterized protein n=1 Tax=Alternaria metachromatica TaxID=283354 RepID=UPI0020C51FA2|nr:uncharacterized protein J4E83_000763 [Alternaria metachromatica]KAI4637945.1 hypothetical protein J4E83_000763 [Alternaria metachromatica]